MGSALTQKDSIIESVIKDEVFSDGYEYFFSFLTDRFEYATELWANELEKKFNKKFKPIWILSARQNDLLMSKKENYVIINTLIEEKFKELKDRNGIKLDFIEEPDDLNKLFSKSSFIKSLIDKLSEKQGRIFILTWTNSFFDINNSKIIFLGPKPHLVTKFDDKAEQIKIFKELDVARNESVIYDNFEDVKTKASVPFFISATYSSGGFENGPILSQDALEKFGTGIRSKNKNNKFIVSKLIRDVEHSPNVSIIVLGENKTQVICVTDQILRQHKYLGNIYPSKISDKIKQEIIEISKKIGNYMSVCGFRGVFGIDFMIDKKNNLYTVDINPRRQGGYMCNVLMSKKINIVELELKAALGEEIDIPDYKDFQVDYFWGHTKLKPYYNPIKINNQLNEGSLILPFTKKGSEFKTIFYSKDSLFSGGCVGCFITSGNSYDEVIKRVLTESEIILSKYFDLYTV